MSDALNSDTPIEINTVRQQADLLIDETQLQAGFDRMAEQITRTMGGLDPLVLCIMLGGLYATVELTKRLDFPLEIDYLHATRYAGDTRGGELVWKVSPGTDLADRHILVIDDILDEGMTLASTLNAIEAQGAASIRTAMLLQKVHNRREPALQADFLGFEIPDRFAFGAGLDYKGYFRQLPAVYAVAPEHED